MEIAESHARRPGHRENLNFGAQTEVRLIWVYHLTDDEMSCLQSLESTLLRSTVRGQARSLVKMKLFFQEYSKEHDVTSL